MTEEVTVSVSIDPGVVGAAKSVPGPVAAPYNQLAGFVYAPLISNQLDLERARKASIEGRALAVVQLSGGFVTIFATLVGFAVGKTAQPARTVLIIFAVAAALFLVAAGLAIVANYRGNSRSSFAELPSADLRRWLDHWQAGDQAEASHEAALDQVRVLDGARRLNTQKRQFLSLAVLAEVAAIATLILAVVQLVSAA